MTHRDREREIYSMACIIMVENFMQVHLWMYQQQLQHGNCGVLHVLSLERNEC